MTHQRMYQAIVCVLRATQTISQHLEPSTAAHIQERIENLTEASLAALENRDNKTLRTLCDEVTLLGSEVKALL